MLGGDQMKQSWSKGETDGKTTCYLGSGLAIRAAIGVIFGLILIENLALGSAIGTDVGLIVGAATDARERR